MQVNGMNTMHQIAAVDVALVLHCCLLECLY